MSNWIPPDWPNLEWDGGRWDEIVIDGMMVNETENEMVRQIKWDSLLRW